MLHEHQYLYYKLTFITWYFKKHARVQSLMPLAPVPPPPPPLHLNAQGAACVFPFSWKRGYILVFVLGRFPKKAQERRCFL